MKLAWKEHEQLYQARYKEAQRREKIRRKIKPAVKARMKQASATRRALTMRSIRRGLAPASAGSLLKTSAGTCSAIVAVADTTERSQALTVVVTAHGVITASCCFLHDDKHTVF